MVQWKRDSILGVCILAFSLVNIIYVKKSITSTTIAIKAAQPDVYLVLWLGIMAVLAFLLIIKSLRHKPETIQKKIWGKLQIFTVVAFAAYLFVMEYIGYLAASFIFLSMMIYVYSRSVEKKKGSALKKQVALCLILSLVTAVLTEQLFRNVLGVVLPTFKLF